MEVVSELVSEVFRSPSALSVLTYLSLHHTEELAVLSWCVTPLLDQLSDQMTIGQVRAFLSLLARLVWRPSVSQHDDQLVIFVKKQLNTSSPFYRRLGVVGVVVCARAMVATHRRLSDIFGEPVAESSRNESRLELSGLLIEAQELLQFAEARTESDPAMAGLFLDEITTSFLGLAENDSSLDFIKHIRKDQVDKIETDYVKEQVDLDMKEFNIPMSCELELVDEDKHFVLILAKKVMEGTFSANRKSLASLARLIPTLRLAVKSLSAVSQVEKSESRLEDLVSLLGCSVLTFSTEVTNNLKSFSEPEKNAICSTHFYIINWMIELINSFSLEEEAHIRKLVLLRLKQIISMREKVQLLLKSNPTFKPPAALFSEDTSKWTPPVTASQNKTAKSSKKGKGKKTRTVLSASMMSLDSQSTLGTQVARIVSQGSKEAKTRPVDLRHYRPFFRELDLACCLAVIGGEPVTTELPPDFEEEANDPKLRPPELLFLLRDLHLKLENIVRSKVFPGSKGFSQAGFTNLHLLSEIEIITAVKNHLKYILSHLDELKEYFRRLQDLSEGREDMAKLFTPDTLVNMDCVKVGLQSLNSFFSWSAFKAARNEDLLRASLLEIVGRVVEVEADSDLSYLVTESLKYLSTFLVCAVTADVAAVHLTLMSSLAELKEEVGRDGSVMKVAEKYIEEDWRDVTGEKDKGAEYNASVGKILKVFIENSHNVYEVLSSVCQDGTSHVIETSKQSEKFPLINKGTLNIVYKTVLPSLVSEVKKLTSGPSKDSKVQYSQWSGALETYVTLITDLQRVEKTKPIVLWNAALKHSKPFIEHFIKQGRRVEM